MANFVAVCSKNGQRVELSLSKATIEEAKSELHNQGYAIIEIHESAEASDAQSSLSTFYFDILVDGKVKSGQIKSADSFRAYIKLVDDLHYQVLSIYESPASGEDERKFFTNRIREMYAVYKGSGAKKGPAKDAPSGAPKPTEADATPAEPTSVLARQVAKYHSLIERTVVKVEFLLANFPTQLGEDRVFRLKELVTALKQLKNTTNADKLKIVGETALDSIGKLEIELIEKGFVKDKKAVLGQTNELLRGMGSSKRVVLPEDDFVVQAKVFWKGFQENYLAPAVEKVSKGSSASNADLSTSEFVYFKNVRELKAYEAKRSEINRELFRGTFRLRGEKKDRLLLKRKLIEQNIELLSSRIKNRSVSYVKIKRGVFQYSESFFYLSRTLGDFLAYSAFAYAMVYSVSYPLSKILSDTELPHRFAFALAAISFVGFCLKQARSWKSFSAFALAAFAFASALSVNF